MHDVTGTRREVRFTGGEKAAQIGVCRVERATESDHPEADPSRSQKATAIEGDSTAFSRHFEIPPSQATPANRMTIRLPTG